MTPEIESLTAAPLIGAEQIALLEKLSNASAVSGDEAEVRAIVLEEVKSFADEIRVDALGNVLVTHHAQSKDALKVMVAAHMDEVGLILVDAEENGLFRFEIVGGIDPRFLAGKPVLVGRDHIPGVIGARPHHLTTPEERKVGIPLENLRIDLGLGGAGKTKPGDRAVFATQFKQIGPSLVGKALDNRLGVASLIELLKHAPTNITLQAAFTVQEEIGLRGARVAAFAFHPDLAIAIDSTPAVDLPVWDGSENTQYNTRLGYGPAVYIADAGTISDPRLVRYLAKTAEALRLPFQYRQPGGGGTDAGAIHLRHGGIPSVSLSVPGRYAHSPVLVARLSDWQAFLSLLFSALQLLTKDVITHADV